jgi:amidohydrolase
MTIRKRETTMKAWLIASAALSVLAAPALAAPADPRAEIARQAQGLEAKLIATRRDIHAHPELGNQEVRTAKLVADHLRGLGLEVRAGVGGTGVVAVLKGGRPGPVVALRADMDALPIKEEVDLPFASREKAVYLGKPVDVMHACGHDAHTAILMTVAELLTRMKAQLPGTVVFYFQPAEEGSGLDLKPGQLAGAQAMIAEGAMANPKPDAVFGLHVLSIAPAGQLWWQAGPTAAATDDLDIKVIGRGTHAARPWGGVDPIVVSAQVLLGLQTVISRQTDISSTPAVVTLGTINGGVRSNVISDQVAMTGTIRSYDDAIRTGLHERVRRTAMDIASSGGAKAEVVITKGYDPAVNDPALTEKITPALMWAAKGDARPRPGLGATGDDFGYFEKVVPGSYFYLGITPRDRDPATAPSNHNPGFFVDESALIVGVRALAAVTFDYLQGFRTR